MTEQTVEQYIQQANEEVAEFILTLAQICQDTGDYAPLIEVATAVAVEANRAFVLLEGIRVGVDNGWITVTDPEAVNTPNIGMYL